MSKGSQAPAAPDYTGAAQATAAGNLDAAKYATEANRVNTYTPYGSLTYAQDPSNSNKWTSTVDLSSTGQQLLDQQNKTSLGLGNLQDSATQRVGQATNSALPTAYDASGAKQGSVYDPTQATNNASDLIMARLAPQQAIDKATLDSQLANQGITQGSEAYDRAQAALARDQNDAKQQAQLQGITLGQSQQAQTYGQQSNNTAQNAALQNQQYAQQTANRNIPINELNAIRTGSQVTNPTFQQAPQQSTTNGADYLGAASATGNYNQGLYGSQVGSNNSLTGALGALGGSLLSSSGGISGLMGLFSDNRLKSNIKRIGTHDKLGIGIYSYIKFGKPEIGVIAQELEQVMPEAVYMHESGFKFIDVGAL